MRIFNQKNYIFVCLAAVMVLFQNCGASDSLSVTELSSSIEGEKIIAGELLFFDKVESEYYEQYEEEVSGINISLPMTSVDMQVKQFDSASSNNELGTNYLCMVKPFVGNQEYFPIGFYDLNPDTFLEEDIIQPVCMQKFACEQLVIEIATEVHTYKSELCEMSSLVKHFTTEQVLQLVKTY